MHYPILELSRVEETFRAKMAVPGRNPCQTRNIEDFRHVALDVNEFRQA